MLKTTESRLWQHANYCCVSQANFKAHSLAGALYKKMLLDGGGADLGGGPTYTYGGLGACLPRIMCMLRNQFWCILRQISLILEMDPYYESNLDSYSY